MKKIFENVSNYFLALILTEIVKLTCLFVEIVLSKYDSSICICFIVKISLQDKIKCYSHTGIKISCVYDFCFNKSKKTFETELSLLNVLYNTILPNANWIIFPTDDPAVNSQNKVDEKVSISPLTFIILTFFFLSLFKY